MCTLLYIHEVDQSEVALKSDEVIVSKLTWKNTTERQQQQRPKLRTKSVLENE